MAGQKKTGGCTGNVLYVDLAKKKVRKEELSTEAVQFLVGMRVLTSKLLWDRVRVLIPCHLRTSSPLQPVR